MKPQGHYHVDVFRADGRYLRGFTLQRVGETSTYRVVDDCGIFFPRDTALSEPLPVGEALRQALAETRKHVDGAITPVFGSAPFDLLGYEPPRFFKPDQEVGPDGRPGRPIPRGTDLVLACAEAAIGNKSEYGKIVVNGRELRFRCDCSSHVDLWVELPEGGAWLTRKTLREIGELAATRHGVTVAW